MKITDTVQDCGSRMRARVVSWCGRALDACALMATAVVLWVTERPRVAAVVVSVAQAWNRCATTVVRVIRWRGWAVAARVAAHAAWVAGRCVWARVRQPVLDAAGWLGTAPPRWRGRESGQSRGVAPRVAWWVPTRAGIGGWWLLTRSLWWCTAVADYADLVRQVRDDQRHGTAKRLRRGVEPEPHYCGPR